MSELEQKQHKPEQSSALNSCPVQWDPEPVSADVGAANPLFQIVPDAGLGDRAYGDQASQGRCFNGPEPDWLSRLLWPPPEDIVDIALKAAGVASVVGALAFARGIRPAGGMPKQLIHPKSSAPRPAPSAQAAKATPQITADTNEKMLRQAIDHVKVMAPSAKERTAALDELLSQVQQLSKDYWKFARGSGTDGSAVFYGGRGEAIIVNPQGQLFLGGLRSGGMHRAETGENLFVLDFSRLRPVR